MSKYIDAERLKAEIERLKEICTAQIKANPGQTFPFVMEMTGYDKLLSFLSTLESEKPMNLEEEINLWISENENIHHGDKLMVWLLKDVARYFAEWGYLRAVEKYNEIEYNRQRAEESVPKDLEEAAEISFDEAYALTEDYRDFLAKGLTENKPRPIGPHWFCEYAKNRFIAGAKWQKNQMMKEAVEGEITKDNRGNNVVRAGVFNKDFEYGDKVSVIVCKKED